MPFGYVYLTVNNKNGKKYVGKHEKSVFDPSYLGSGKYIKRSIKKHTAQAFEVTILEWCDTREDLNFAERKWIEQYNAVDLDEFYNLRPGGDGGSSRGGKAPWFGKTRDEETRRKISDALKGKPLSDERKAAISAGITGASNPFYGKTHTEATKARIAEANRTRVNAPRSAESRARTSKAFEGKTATCPHCGKTGGLTGIRRWHFDNCRQAIKCA